MSLFHITPEDIQSKLAPASSSVEANVSADVSESVLNEIILTAEDKVISALPHKYRDQMTTISEVATWRSRAGQTSFPLSFAPVANTASVYLNYPFTGRAWALRGEDDELDASGWSISGNTLSITTAPAKGSSVFVNYVHNAANTFAAVRDQAVTLAACEYARRFWFHRDTDAAERFTQWETAFAEWSKAIGKGYVGIPTLDAINTVNDSAMGELAEDVLLGVLRW